MTAAIVPSNSTTSSTNGTRRAASSRVYLRYELTRSLRNVRFFAFSLVFPLILFLLVATPNRHEELGGIPFPLYFMTGMAAWGSMTAVVAGGARISMERSIGWNRQLRVTPLSTRSYLQAKVLSGYLLASCSIVILYVAGAAVGVRLPATDWVTMTALILVGLAPFAAMGVMLGHLLTPDSMGPAMGGITSLFGLVGGVWGPIAEGGFLHRFSELVPSYWLVQAGGTALGGDVWPLKAWIVLGVWTLVLTRLAVRAWQRDTHRA